MMSSPRFSAAHAGRGLSPSLICSLRCALSLTASVPPSGALTQAIRNFAKSLEGWLNTAMNAVPQRMVQTKVSVRCLPTPPVVTQSLLLHLWTWSDLFMGRPFLMSGLGVL